MSSLEYAAGDRAPARSRLSVEEYVIAGVLAVMVGILFLQVVARFVFSDSISWSEELARYLFIWLIFIGLGAVVLRAEHVAIDALVVRLPQAARRVLAQLCHLVMLVVNIALVIKGVELAYIIGDLGQTSPALSLDMWVVYTALPAGMAVASIRTVQSSIRLWRGAESPAAGAGRNEGDR